MVLLSVLLLAAGTTLSRWDSIAYWAAGQILLVWFFMLVFCQMHEFGHRSYFPGRRLNFIFGLLTGIASGVPFVSWHHIHHLHHRWTGWRDRDPTTRVTTFPPSAGMAKVMNFSWRYWLPLFSIGYRVNTYWNLRLLQEELPPAAFRQCKINIALQLLFYAALVMVLGPTEFAKIFAVSFLVSMSLMDPVLLSQHSHIHMPLVREEHPERFEEAWANLRPMTTTAQVPYTRSIIFPDWISLLLLTGFDRHEEHHRTPVTAGYLLAFRKTEFARSYPALDWIRRAKKIPAARFIFETEKNSGFQI